MLLDMLNWLSQHIRDLHLQQTMSTECIAHLQNILESIHFEVKQEEKDADVSHCNTHYVVLQRHIDCRSMACGQ